jgi:hypothetical protein
MHCAATPLYLGNRHARRRGREHEVFILRYVETASRLFPGARHARGIRRGTQA